MSGQVVMKVTSEILPYFERDLSSKPLLNNHNIISKFSFTCPKPDDATNVKVVEKDADGDYILERKSSVGQTEQVITLEHSVSTELSLVGLQVWRGALLLADFVLHRKAELQDQHVLELGSGVGLTSLVAAIFAKRVICTDIDLGDILKLIASNIQRNKRLINAEITIQGLDFFHLDWPSELEEQIKNASIVLAADVIYDNDVTEAFVKTITKILSLPTKKTLYIALEKRYVFTVCDMDSVAPCYEHLLSVIKEAQKTQPWRDWTMVQEPLDFPQFFNYERVRQLVLWKIQN